MKLFLPLMLGLIAHGALGAIDPGLYYDPDRTGHGFDLQPVGGRWVMVFYTYQSDGSPTWYLGVLEEQPDGSLGGRIDAFDYDSGLTPPQQATGNGGEVTLDFSHDCNESLGALPQAAFTWSLQGETGQWCVTPLIDQEIPLEADFTGLWYAGTDDQGWGLTLDFAAVGDEAVEVQVLFYYDSEGQARWALGVSESGGPDASVDVQNFVGYCRTCEPRELESVPAGTITHQLGLSNGRPVGTVDLDVDYALEPGGEWARSGPIELLSDPARGLIPLPDQLDPEQVTVFVDTNVVTLDDSKPAILEHQTVLVADGLISAMGPVGTVSIPPNAWHIDGRDLYLGPGLHDMHTHFTYGGVTPMLEAGLLFIANGVTTVLNMGDGLTQDLPGTDDIFGSGTRIGPTVHAGLIVYGPGDNRAANVTVNSPDEVPSYVSAGVDMGYDFIKVYNAVSPEVFEAVIAEGESRALPVIGHLPKTMSMERALQSGQQMIAHVAEVYFTLFGNQPREELLPVAAQLMLNHGVYLTDTLTASESFAAMYGGNEANFEAYMQREGVRFIPSSFIRGGWRSFFESSTLQPAGSRPGQLDDRLVFFKQMVKYFADAGVPVILGTDSPGHVGVISGFSVHENLRLYEEIGLSPEAAYRAAAANPGRFLAESLALEHPAGMIAAGHRADLLLLEGNPLDDITNLRHPVGVMTRGRFHSRELLDAELEKLDQKYPGPFAELEKSIEPVAEYHQCRDFDH